MPGDGGVLLECDLLPVSRYAGVLPDTLVWLCVLSARSTIYAPYPAYHTIPSTPVSTSATLTGITIHRGFVVYTPRRFCYHLAMKTRPYIAYFRVSTTRQGRSGLGLEAQQQAVNVFLNGHGELIVESLPKSRAVAGTTGRNSPPRWKPAANTKRCC